MGLWSVASGGIGVHDAERGVGEDFALDGCKKGLAVDFLRIIEGGRR